MRQPQRERGRRMTKPAPTPTREAIEGGVPRQTPPPRPASAPAAGSARPAGPPQPRRFADTAAAKVSTQPRKPLSEYVGQELCLHGYRYVANGPHGPYVIIRLQRHGQPSEYVQTSGELIIEQLEAVDPGSEGNWAAPIIGVWLRQRPGSPGRQGLLYFAAE